MIKFGDYILDVTMMAMPDNARQADEPEITPAMIEAGRRAFWDWYSAGGTETFDVTALIRSVLETTASAAPSRSRKCGPLSVQSSPQNP